MTNFDDVDLSLDSLDVDLSLDDFNLNLDGFEAECVAFANHLDDVLDDLVKVMSKEV